MFQPGYIIYLLHKVSAPFSQIVNYLDISVMCNLEIFKGTEPLYKMPFTIIISVCVIKEISSLNEMLQTLIYY